GLEVENPMFEPSFLRQTVGTQEVYAGVPRILFKEVISHCAGTGILEQVQGGVKDGSGIGSGCQSNDRCRGGAEDGVHLEADLGEVGLGGSLDGESWHRIASPRWEESLM